MCFLWKANETYKNKKRGAKMILHQTQFGDYVSMKANKKTVRFNVLCDNTGFSFTIDKDKLKEGLK